MCYAVDSFRSILSCSQTHFQSSDTNYGPRSEMPVRGVPFWYHTYWMNSLASCRVSVSFLQVIRSLILVGLSAIMIIELHPFDQGSLVTKSIDMSSDLRWGIDKGLSTPNGTCRAVRALLQVWKFLPNLSTLARIPCQSYYLQINFNFFDLPGCPVAGLSWWISI